MTYRERTIDVICKWLGGGSLTDEITKAFAAVENEVLAREFPHYRFSIAPVVEAERQPVLGEMCGGTDAL